MIFEPIDNSSANIVELKVKPRPSADEGAMLQPVPHSHCRHTYTSFEIDIDAGKCVCKKCGEEVTPIFVLRQLMHMESRWMQTRSAYQDEMKRLDERSRTKCQHCNKITRIS